MRTAAVGTCRVGGLRLYSYGDVRRQSARYLTIVHSNTLPSCSEDGTHTLSKLSQ